MYQQLRLELYAVHNTFQLQGTEGNHQTHPYYISLFSCEKALYCAKARGSMAYETISHNYFTSWGKLRLIPEIYISFLANPIQENKFLSFNQQKPPAINATPSGLLMDFFSELRCAIYVMQMPALTPKFKITELEAFVWL
ncbi:uncharacterized protein LOC114318789 [Camellia sinensis]|uniref:uncharacterized protein LOC114318789 n=1 Tax=Camellia sinensis TaxID=4442 RepID=UPI001036C08F|nr:uncharacterized protein LOC114318789 [Camellia sinensis]